MSESKPRLVALGGEEAAPPAAPPAQRAPGDSRALWTLGALLALAVLALAVQTRRVGGLQERVDGLESELSQSRSALSAHRARLAEVRAAVSQLQSGVAELEALVSREPSQPSPPEAAP